MNENKALGLNGLADHGGERPGGHEFVQVGNRRWCLGCDLFQRREPPGNKPFPTPRNECARSTPYAYEKDRTESLDSIGWFGSHVASKGA